MNRSSRSWECAGEISWKFVHLAGASGKVKSVAGFESAMTRAGLNRASITAQFHDPVKGARISLVYDRIQREELRLRVQVEQEASCRESRLRE